MEIQGPRHWVKVQVEKLDADAALSFLGKGNVGAVDVFIGMTRRFTGKKETVRLEYDVYPEMATAEMVRIGTEALDEWAVERVVLIHRVGHVPAGEASVIVGASAPHRAAAFEACRYLIDTLKTRAPIWKKEKYADGTEDWVGHANAKDN